ncbi:MAG: hypothetical protein F6K62_10250 [Sphaerospermopsis sp. SIO1G2]|nr:hypothetical protein [Sphaerospermopsis sp. SIO1G2]
MSDDADSAMRPAVVKIPTREQLEAMKIYVQGAELVGTGSNVPSDIAQELKQLNNMLLSRNLLPVDMSISSVSEASSLSSPGYAGHVQTAHNKRTPSVP